MNFLFDSNESSCWKFIKLSSFLKCFEGGRLCIVYKSCDEPYCGSQCLFASDAWHWHKFDLKSKPKQKYVVFKFFGELFPFCPAQNKMAYNECKKSIYLEHNVSTNAHRRAQARYRLSVIIFHCALAHGQQTVGILHIHIRMPHRSYAKRFRFCFPLLAYSHTIYPLSMCVCEVDCKKATCGTRVFGLKSKRAEQRAHKFRFYFHFQFNRTQHVRHRNYSLLHFLFRLFLILEKFHFILRTTLSQRMNSIEVVFLYTSYIKCMLSCTPEFLSASSDSYSEFPMVLPRCSRRYHVVDTWQTQLSRRAFLAAS